MAKFKERVCCAGGVVGDYPRVEFPDRSLSIYRPENDGRLFILIGLDAVRAFDMSDDMDMLEIRQRRQGTWTAYRLSFVRWPEGPIPAMLRDECDSFLRYLDDCEEHGWYSRAGGCSYCIRELMNEVIE